jgi:hypothetical protein
MEFLNILYQFVSGKEFSIPLWEVILYVIFISFCLLFGKHRLGLLTSYGFVFYWGFLSNMNDFFNIASEYKWEMPVYIFSGFFMFVVVLLGFFVQDNG